MYLYKYIEIIQSYQKRFRIFMIYLRQINFQILIDNNVSLKDIKVYIKLLMDNYYLTKHFTTNCLHRIL